MEGLYTVLEYDPDKGVSQLHRVEVVNALDKSDAERQCMELWKPREWGVGGPKAFKGTPEEAFPEFLVYAGYYTTPVNQVLGSYYKTDDTTPLSSVMIKQYVQHTGVKLNDPDILSQLI